MRDIQLKDAIYDVTFSFLRGKSLFIFVTKAEEIKIAILAIYVTMETTTVLLLALIYYPKLFDPNK